MIRFTVTAVDDLKRLKTFLEERNQQAAGRALDLIWSTFDQIDRFPQLGSITDDPLVRQVFTRFGRAGYLIRYVSKRDTDIIVITRIWHSRESRE